MKAKKLKPQYRVWIQVEEQIEAEMLIWLLQHQAGIGQCGLDRALKLADQLHAIAKVITGGKDDTGCKH